MEKLKSDCVFILFKSFRFCVQLQLKFVGRKCAHSHIDAFEIKERTTIIPL